jgi:succinate-semialdehyde dehydrogenase/glutarate-semialdehyde dehydrogenase
MLPLQDLSLLRSHCYVNGKSTGTPSIEVLNPSTGALVGKVPNLGVADAGLAVAAAKAAFRRWAGLTGSARAAHLKAWHRLIRANRHDLATILTAEQGKPFAEAMAEIDYAAEYVEFYAEEATRLSGEVIAAGRTSRSLVLRQPSGVVAAITPWNFPAAMITRKAAPALAAGCTVVLKPAPQTPFTALALVELADRAGLPAGVMNVVTGDAVSIGSVLTTHPDVRVLTFTGSTDVGKLLMRQCSSTAKKVLLELGGNAPFIVFEDADLDEAVAGAMASKFRNSGQTCVCANRFYVQDSIYNDFVDRLASKVAKLAPGDGFDPAATQGPLIDEAAVLKMERHVEDALASGGRLVTGGRRVKPGSRFFTPTVVAEVSGGALVTREETFGPLAAVLRFKTERQVVDAANESPFGLAAYVYTNDLARAFRMMEALETGMVGINTGRLSNVRAPFGGIKESGNSREGSAHGLLEFTDLKYCSVGLPTVQLN